MRDELLLELVLLVVVDQAYYAYAVVYDDETFQLIYYVIFCRLVQSSERLAYNQSSRFNKPRWRNQRASK